MNTPLMSGVLIATLLAHVPAFAQAPAVAAPLAERFLDPENGLTLDAAVALALAQEPSLRAARSLQDAAEGMRLQASLRPNPSVSVERREEPGGTDSVSMVGVQWPLDLFRRGSRVAVAEGEVIVARFAADDRERLLAAEVRARYGDLAFAVRDLALLDETVEAVRRQHDLIRSRADEGAAPRLERDLLDVELRRLESERLLQAGRADAASFELTRVLGLMADAPITVRDTPEDLVGHDLSSMQGGQDGADVARERADLREAAARIDVAEARVEQAKNMGRLDVSLLGGYMRMDAGFPQRGFAPDGTLARIRGLFHNVSVGAMVTVPIRDRNQGAVAAARAERAGALAVHEAVQLSVQAELAAARTRHEHARRALRIYTDGTRALARQNLTVVSQSYELGRMTVLDVMSEQRRFLDVERAYTQALREVYEARTALDRALGARR